MSLEDTPAATGPTAPAGGPDDATPQTAMEPRIVKTPDTCFGAARIRDHRMPVWVLVGYRKAGLTPAEVNANYPHLTPDQLDAAWAYYQANTNEIERSLWYQQTAGNIPEGVKPPAWVVIAGLTLGMPADKVCDSFDPPLTPADLDVAWEEYWADPAAAASLIPRTQRAD